MGIQKTRRGWRAVARVRVAGRVIERGRLCRTREAAKRAVEDLKQDMRENLPAQTGSLTCETFGELSAHFTARRGCAGMEPKFRALERDLGAVKLEDLADAFDVFLYGTDGRGGLVGERSPMTGRKRTAATVNRHIAVAKMVCGFAVESGIMPDNPIKRFKLQPEEGRDRVLSPDEEKALLETLERERSYLLPAVRFSLRNPIRRGDLFRLARENWDEINGAVHFQASKTRRRRQQKTVLVCLDDDTRAWFRGLPADCPLLFPKLLPDGSWREVGNIRKHWERMTALAGIEDFRFHDLKHCAITFMRDVGFAEKDFEDMGIQFSTAMIRRYYNADPRKAVEKWRQLAAAV